MHVERAVGGVVMWSAPSGLCWYQGHCIQLSFGYLPFSFISLLLAWGRQTTVAHEGNSRGFAGFISLLVWKLAHAKKKKRQSECCGTPD